MRTRSQKLSGAVRHQGEEELRATFRALGAVSPASARSGKDLPAVDSASFDRLLRGGVIREGAPGTFYLYEPPARPSLVFRQLLFFFVFMSLPIVMIEVCGRTP